MIAKGWLIAARQEETIADRVVEQHAGDGFRNGGELRGRAVNRHEERRAEADVRIIRYHEKLLVGGGEEVDGFADGRPAVGLDRGRAGANDAVAECRQHDGFAGVLMAEVIDAVVVANDLDVAKIVRVVKGEQLIKGRGCNVCRFQRRNVGNQRARRSRKRRELPDQQQRENKAREGQASLENARASVFAQPTFPRPIRAKQGDGTA